MAAAVIGAAFSVVLKALAPITDPVLEAWAASKDLGPNVKSLKTELLCVKAVLEENLGREIRNSALEELLGNLQDLAYDAEDVLDELEYFRIQDQLHGTFEAVDEHPKGCAHNLAFNATHTAKAVGKLIWSPACCSSTATPASRLQPREPQAADRGEVDGCMRKIASGPHNTIRAVGKCLPCSSSLPPVLDDDDDNDDSDDCDNVQIKYGKEITKLEFNRVDVSKRIKLILAQLQPMCQKICMVLGTLGSDLNTVKHSRPATISESVEPKMYGRDCTMNSMIHDIIRGKSCAEDLTVIPIVGPGGIGKTTLAQHIYHKREVQNHFEVKVWVCVSLNFNADNITKEIEKCIPTVGDEKGGTPREVIEQRLKSKRFLLVLDDIWKDCSEDEWKKVLLPLKKSQVKGNIIVVTTRFPALAQMVKEAHDSIPLQGLNNEEFKELFLTSVFDDEQSRMNHPELVETGDKIRQKLKGSPLAAKTVCALLRKHLDFNHWSRVLESQEWKEQKGENDIMPALKLSYDYLPFYLQPCFSYCALFPQDYKFGREELIHLWIGLDVLHSLGENKRIEDIGLIRLEELVDHAFLKNERGKDGKTYYIMMHDLLHELAAKVSTHECLSIYSYNVGPIQCSPSIRHLSINIDDTSVGDKLTFDSCTKDLSTLNRRLKVENLHSLILFGEHHGSFVKTFGSLFKEAKALRVLFLSKASYNVEDLLPNFLKLIHLRYLRIQSANFSEIELPNNISTLYHLKVLDLKRCDARNVFPRDITNLTKLRHLLVQNNEMHSSISEVGKLKWLQELRRFVVKKETRGFELRQIRDLVELSGSLRIDNLEKVEVKEEADEAKLMQKNRLHELVLHWDIGRSTKDPAQDDHVLENLKPNSNLLKLSISGHGGDTCPSWLGMNLFVKTLESLRLNNVSWKTFPPLGEMWFVGEHCKSYIPEQSFKKLKRLELEKVPKLIKWVGNGRSDLFSHLEVLAIRDCPELMELPFSHSAGHEQEDEVNNMTWFPKLEKLEVTDCPKLSSLPRFPWSSSTCTAYIAKSGSGIERLYFGNFSSTGQILEIKGKDTSDSAFWRVLAFHNLSKLEILQVTRCPPLSLVHLEKLSSLKTLRMDAVGDAFCSAEPEGDGHVGYQFPVEHISIRQYGASGQRLTRMLSYFPNLLSFRISKCEKLTWLGIVGQHKRTEALPRPRSILVNEVEEAQVGAEEEISAATTSEGVLLLPHQLQHLVISYCQNLVLCPGLLDQDEDAGRIGGGGLQGLSSLTSLSIHECPRFLSSYSSSASPCFPFPASLEYLSLHGVVGRETLLPLSNLTSLTKLDIQISGDLKGKGLQSLLAQGRLTKLTVRGTPNFFAGSEPSPPREQGLPSSSSKLQELRTDDAVGVLAAPICTFLSASLIELDFSWVREVERFTKEQEEALQLFTSLESIRFWCCDKLQCLPAGLHRLSNLKRLGIEYCAAIRSLPKEGLPSSLQELGISFCPAIRSIPKECLPKSLQKLVIWGCPAIRSLPKVDDLPSSLRELGVRHDNSEELRRQFRKLIGTIPIVRA